MNASSCASNMTVRHVHFGQYLLSSKESICIYSLIEVLHERQAACNIVHKQEAPGNLRIRTLRIYFSMCIL
jgi:hypothetical protein